ncbi:tryptophanyl-tRNA synthetase [Zymobacter palmae]|uniref:Tryptophanyl-tRNA synthetase n=2 Tax=Zymobacter palmae TaxID=33074 RepID=A0A348HCA5_9GAMM|nr:tryptophanyl-tRNA synthetase [Zymobacter palmae]
MKKAFGVMAERFFCEKTLTRTPQTQPHHPLRPARARTTLRDRFAEPEEQPTDPTEIAS